jgi:hypothetical protein
MDAIAEELSQALSRLMRASMKIDPASLEESGRTEYLEARENAAKALLKNRVRAGRAWVTPAELSSYFERWATLRAGMAEPAAGGHAAAAEPS